MQFKAFESAARKRLLVGLLLVFGLILLLSALRYLRPAPDTALPRLGLMTTLPLPWSEGGVAAALDDEAPTNPAYVRLTQHWQMVPIDDLAQLNKQSIKLLLMAQPRAFSASELVALDKWTRAGGHLLILADPALQWESDYPPGDARRPLFTSLLSPLFGHWGVELVLPITGAEPIVTRAISSMNIRTQTPGEWQPRAGAQGARCNIDATKLVADCMVGQGRAYLVADADLLDGRYWTASGLGVLSGGDDFDNLTWVEWMLRDLMGSDNGKSGR